MRDKVLVISSIVLLVLSFIIAANKTIVPILKEEKLKIEQEIISKEISDKIKEREEQLNNKDKDTNIIATEVPKTDGQRVGMYIGKYIALINEKNYAQAYELLNPNFKQENFPTLESYETYVKSKFDRLKSIEYESFRLEGTIYIVKTKIKDVPIYGDVKEFNQIFMFKELTPGKYEISFGL